MGKGDIMQGNHFGIDDKSLCGQGGLVLIDADVAEKINQPITFDHCLACWFVVFLWGQLGLVGVSRPWAEL